MPARLDAILFIAALLSSCGNEPAKTIDLKKPVYTTDNAYGCLDKSDLKDITIDAMDRMDKGAQFETCAPMKDQPVRVIEHDPKKIFYRIEPMNASPGSYADVWVFDNDLTNAPPEPAN